MQLLKYEVRFVDVHVDLYLHLLHFEREQEEKYLLKLVHKIKHSHLHTAHPIGKRVSDIYHLVILMLDQQGYCKGSERQAENNLQREVSVDQLAHFTLHKMTVHLHCIGCVDGVDDRANPQ